MRGEARQHFEAGVIMKLTNDPLASKQNLIGQRLKHIRLGALAINLHKIDMIKPELPQD